MLKSDSGWEVTTTGLSDKLLLVYLSGNKCQQHRSGPFHLTTTLHPAPLLYRRGKLTPFYPLRSKVPTQSDIPQKYFKDQRRQCGDPSEKTCQCPPRVVVVVGGALEIKWNGPSQRKFLFPQQGFSSWQNTNSSYGSLKLYDLSFQKNRCSRPDLPSSHHRCFHMIVSSILWLHLERTRHDPGDCKGTWLEFQLRRNDSRLLNL